MEIQDLIREGIVSAVDAEKRIARVIFADQDEIVSGWLRIIRSAGTPEVGTRVLCVFRAVFNGDGYVIGVIGEV
ncbi:MAG: hypothetical protein LBD85_04370 [Oscillospiraceae bacterium]|jgi:phage baseplate assembly protein gpV|nr:hypothetical protein [Oscillospiraceae bacterium]